MPRDIKHVVILLSLLSLLVVLFGVIFRRAGAGETLTAEFDSGYTIAELGKDDSTQEESR